MIKIQQQVQISKNKQMKTRKKWTVLMKMISKMLNRIKLNKQKK